MGLGFASKMKKAVPHTGEGAFILTVTCVTVTELCQGFPHSSVGKETTCQCRDMRRWPVPSLGREDPLEEGMATYSSVLAWRSPWTEEPGRLQSTGSQKV